MMGHSLLLLVFQAYEHAQHIRKPGDKVPVVIGGMVLDIQATPTGGRLLRGSTTPGEVILSFSLPCYVLLLTAVSVMPQIFTLKQVAKETAGILQFQHSLSFL